MSDSENKRERGRWMEVTEIMKLMIVNMKEREKWRENKREKNIKYVTKRVKEKERLQREEWETKRITFIISKTLKRWKGGERERGGNVWDRC